MNEGEIKFEARFRAKKVTIDFSDSWIEIEGYLNFDVPNWDDQMIIQNKVRVSFFEHSEEGVLLRKILSDKLGEEVKKHGGRLYARTKDT